MKAVLRTILIMIAIAIIAPSVAVASDTGGFDTERYFASRDGRTMIAVGEIDFDDPYIAAAVVDLMTPREVEAAMGGIVLKQEPMPIEQQRFFGLDAMTLTAGMLPDGTAYLLAIFAKDGVTGLAMMAGDDLDGGAFAEWTVVLFADGAEHVSAPIGFSELTDDADSDVFDALTGGSI